MKTIQINSLREFNRTLKTLRESGLIEGEDFQRIGNAGALEVSDKAEQVLAQAEAAPPKRITGAKTRLERHVQKWLNERAKDYPDDGVQGVLKDLFHGGCESGIVSHLIYYTDTVKFFQTHRREISELLAEAEISGGWCNPAHMFGEKWDKADPLAQEDQNRNLLAWFGFEETARRLAERNNIEI
ncbi:hypothetical protein KGP36_01765 [Patescibacteria group bacterium]|nr:hypothetical protein [Patescibacteria group bacterium]